MKNLVYYDFDVDLFIHICHNSIELFYRKDVSTSKSFVMMHLQMNLSQ